MNQDSQQSPKRLSRDSSTQSPARQASKSHPASQSRRESSESQSHPGSQSPKRLSCDSSQSSVRQRSKSPCVSSPKGRSSLRRQTSRTSFAEELELFASTGKMEPQWGVLGAPQTVAFRRHVFSQARKLDAAETMFIAGNVATLKRTSSASSRFRWRKYIKIIVMAVRHVRQKELAIAEEARKLLESNEEPQEANADAGNTAGNDEQRWEALRDAGEEPSGPRRQFTRKQEQLQQMQEIAADDRRIAFDLARSADVAGNFSQAFAALQKQSATHVDSLVEINSEIELALAMSKMLCKCMGINRDRLATTRPASQRKERLEDVLASLQSMEQTLDRVREGLATTPQKREDRLSVNSESGGDAEDHSGSLTFLTSGIDSTNTSAADSHKKVHPEDEKLASEILCWLLEQELSKKTQGALDAGVDADTAASDEMPLAEAGAEAHQESAQPAWFSALELAAQVANSKNDSIEDGTLEAFEMALLSACDEIDASEADRQTLLHEVRSAIFGGASPRASKDDPVESQCVAENDPDHEVASCAIQQPGMKAHGLSVNSKYSNSRTNMQVIEGNGDAVYDGDVFAPQVISAITGSKPTEQENLQLLASKFMAEFEQERATEIDLENVLVVHTPHAAPEISSGAAQLNGNASEASTQLKLDQGRVVNAVLAGLATVVAARISKLKTLHLSTVSFPLESLPAPKERKHNNIRKGFGLATEARAKQREQQDMADKEKPVAASVTDSSGAKECLHLHGTPTVSIQSAPCVNMPTQDAPPANIIRRRRLGSRTGSLISTISSASVIDPFEAQDDISDAITTESPKRWSRSPRRRLSAPSPAGSEISTCASESITRHRGSDPVHSREASQSPQRILRVPAGSAVEVIRHSKRRLTRDCDKADVSSLVIEPTASWPGHGQLPSLRSASPAQSTASECASPRSSSDLKLPLLSCSDAVATC